MGRSNFSILIFRRVECISGRGHPRNFEIKKKYIGKFKLKLTQNTNKA